MELPSTLFSVDVFDQEISALKKHDPKDPTIIKIKNHSSKTLKHISN
jgi:hypothetical protein